MTIDLPNVPTTAVPRPVDGGSYQQPIAGGTTTRIDRPGGHMAVDFTTKRLKVTSEAMIWLSRLMQGLRNPVRAIFPQPGVTIGNIGTPVVDGAPQAGLSLKVRGLRAGYTVGEGWALNVYDAAGRAFLHITTGAATSASPGHVTLAVEPMVRCLPADGSTCNLAAPVIEGRMIGADKGLTLKTALTEGLQFTIEETR